MVRASREGGRLGGQDTFRVAMANQCTTTGRWRDGTATALEEVREHSGPYLPVPGAPAPGAAGLGRTCTRSMS